MKPTMLAGLFAATMIAAPVSSAYTETPAAEGGTITGVVRLERPAPKTAPAKITHDVEICGKVQEDESYRLGVGGGLANVVVLLEGVQRGKRIEESVVEVDQRRCHYEPHVVALPAGARLVLKNSDATLHNVHAWMGDESLFNSAMPFKNAKLPPKRPEVTGAFRLGCDVHAWMGAWVYVADHPYVVVTGEDGSFTLTDVPPGQYTLKVWHEVEGERSMKVTVAQGNNDVKLSY